MPEKKFKTKLDELVREKQAKQDSVRARLNIAIAEDPLAEQAVIEAEAELLAIEAGFKRGDSEVTDQAWCLATAAVRRTVLRHDGAKRELSHARSQQVFAHDDVARAYLAVVSTAIPGVEAVATCVDPPKPAEGERPLLVVTQDGETVHTPSGMVAASLTIRYYRAAIHSPLTTRALEDAASKTALVNASVSFVRTEDGFCDVARVTVSGAVVGVPLIRAIENRYRDAAGRAVVSELVRSTLLWDESPSVDHMAGLWESRKIAAAPYGQATMEELVDGSTRSLTVENRIAVRFRAPVETTPLDTVQAAASGLVGSFIGGLGMVESIEVENANEDTAATKVLHAISAKPNIHAFDTSWRIRCTLSSATSVPGQTQARTAA